MRLLPAIALSTFMVFGTTAVASAADTAVTVALFDMTAAGQGFMGQGGSGFGMMGRGGFGQGMMGQGYGGRFGSMWGRG